MPETKSNCRHTFTDQKDVERTLEASGVKTPGFFVGASKAQIVKEQQ